LNLSNKSTIRGSRLQSGSRRAPRNTADWGCYTPSLVQPGSLVNLLVNPPPLNDLLLLVTIEGFWVALELPVLSM